MRPFNPVSLLLLSLLAACASDKTGVSTQTSSSAVIEAQPSLYAGYWFEESGAGSAFLATGRISESFCAGMKETQGARGGSAMHINPAGEVTLLDASTLLRGKIYIIQGNRMMLRMVNELKAQDPKEAARLASGELYVEKKGNSLLLLEKQEDDLSPREIGKYQQVSEASAKNFEALLEACR